MKTLAEYHKTYPARPGDTAEKFAHYEAFEAKDPCPPMESGYGAYADWYERLKNWMEASPVTCKSPKQAL